MTLPLYKKHPDLYCFNSVTKRHLLKKSPAFKKAFAADPSIFVETITMFLPPAQEIPIITTERAPEPLPPSPIIGDPLPVPERQLTREEIEKNISIASQEKVRQIVDEELKTNPVPYEGKKSPELEAMLRAVILAKLTPKPINSKAKKAKGPVFTLRPPVIQEDSSDETGPDSEEE